MRFINGNVNKRKEVPTKVYMVEEKLCKLANRKHYLVVAKNKIKKIKKDGTVVSEAQLGQLTLPFKPSFTSPSWWLGFPHLFSPSLCFYSLDFCMFNTDNPFFLPLSLFQF